MKSANDGSDSARRRSPACAFAGASHANVKSTSSLDSLWVGRPRCLRRHSRPDKNHRRVGGQPAFAIARSSHLFSPPANTWRACSPKTNTPNPTTSSRGSREASVQVPRVGKTDPSRLLRDHCEVVVLERRRPRNFRRGSRHNRSNRALCIGPRFGKRYHFRPFFGCVFHPHPLVFADVG